MRPPGRGARLAVAVSIAAACGACGTSTPADARDAAPGKAPASEPEASGKTAKAGTPSRARPPEAARDRCGKALETMLQGYLPGHEGTGPVDWGELQNVDFRPVIVTVADPIDSRLDEAFDYALNGISLAAAHGYTLDRFWLPWQVDRRELDAGGRPGECHVTHPGVVLYRPAPRHGRDTRLASRSSTAARAKADQPLAILLVGETPTTGVHPRALHRALELVHQLSPTTKRIPVVGPSFSGSARSLADELADHAKSRDLAYDVVTSSATDEPSLAQLDPAHPAGRGAARHAAAAHSAVHSNEELLRTINAYLGRLGIGRGKLALMIESDTAFGEGAQSLALDGRDFGDPWPPTILRFPMHVSRIRSDFERQHGTRKVTIGGYELPALDLGLRQESDHEVKDVLPLLSAVSESYEEAVLAGELTTLRRRRMGAIGVLASDARDRIFLVGKVREYVPDALVFTLGADMLFLYPDLQPATAGTIVVSTYPLFTWAQAWTGGDGKRGESATERVQFTSSAAEGTYNALVWALWRDDEDRLRRELRDYGCPFGDEAVSARPPVWISVVGRDAFWPVAAWCSRELSTVGGARLADSRMPALARANAASCASPQAPAASWAMLLLASLFGCYAAWNGAAVFGARAPAGGALLAYGPYRQARGASRRRQCGWLIVHLAWVSLMALGVAAILSVPGAALPHPEQDWTHHLAVLPAAGAGLALAAALWAALELVTGRATSGHEGWRGQTSGGGSDPVTSRASYCMAGGLALVCVGSAVGAVEAVSSGALTSTADRARVFLFLRMTQFGSGVSPLGALALPALALHLAGHFQLARLHVVDGGRARAWPSHGLLAGFLRDADHDLARSDRTIAGLLPGIRRSHLWWGVLFAALPLPIVLLPKWWTPSPDGAVLDWVYRSLLAATTFVAGLSLWHAWRLWGGLHTILRRLPDLPGGAALRRFADLYPRERRQRLLWAGPDWHDRLIALRLLRAAFPHYRRMRSAPRDDGAAQAGTQGDAPRPRRAELVARVASAAAEPPRSAEQASQVRAMENLLASVLALRLSWALAHLRWVLALAVLTPIAVVLAVALHYQPPSAVMLLASAIALAAGATAIFVYAQHGRNEVLGWLSAGKQKEGLFEVSDAVRWAGLGFAPALGLVSLLFPGFGRWFAQWLGPVFRALQ